ncbi:metabolite-proton symporter [Spinactinospora alkalitolerans]|uniref:Putative proline/betaine transporter n=1 Tax=Spinactinospora alkalitolerans TaxID=687207 RepID=A0A852U2E1_9ACTN|nr:MFS transporter [Spinactinospora alkalitolerans]NYE50291.1 metabolite-proton symporter [Spinactinospora alkalitolerans]
MSERTPQASARPHPARAAIAAFVGTTIEWFDFYVYATAAALVFGTQFFPEGTDPMIGLMASFATFSVGFFARPVGGIVFGHFGDRLGRKSALVTTLLMMGTATFAVGLLPTYAQAGFWAPLALVVLRFVQGIAVGGEWGGAVLMAVEHAPRRSKTFYGSFAQLGNPAGALLATGSFSLITAFGGDPFLQEWGWRLPFLASIVLVLVGLFIRLKVEESPVFSAVHEQAAAAPREAPLREAVRTSWRTLLLGLGALPVAVGGYYIVTTFLQAYATTEAGVSTQVILNALSAAAFIELVATLGVSWLGDRVGTRRIVIIGLLAVAVLAVPQFLAMSWGTVMVFVSVSVMRLAMAATYGPIARILSQMFAPKVRYTSVSLAYQVAGALFGGLAPITCTALLSATGSIYPVAALLVAMSLLSIFCLLKAPSYDDDKVLEEIASA